MADTKITDLTELAVPPAADDWLVVVDKDVTTMAASGTDKKIQFSNMIPSSLGATGYLAGPIASAPASTVVGVTETYFAAVVNIHATRSVTQIRYRVGATSNGNVRAALFASDATTKVADRTTDDAQGAAGLVDTVNFDSTYVAPPGAYFAVVWFSSATATFSGARMLQAVRTGTSSGATPTSLASAATLNAEFPIMVVL